jgi:hypothetical protein
MIKKATFSSLTLLTLRKINPVEDHRLSAKAFSLPSENDKAPRRHDVGPFQNYAEIKKALGLHSEEQKPSQRNYPGIQGTYVF